MTPRMGNVNTLIIDDNAHMISIVRSMLLGFGYPGPMNRVTPWKLLIWSVTKPSI